MSILLKLIREICEKEPALLAALPRERIERDARALFDKGDVYFVEQIDKTSRVASSFDPREVERRMYEALADCRVDDFCYFFDVLGASVVLDKSRISACYERLACKGNVAGLETVIKKTGVAARLDASTAERAYEVLLAMGRLGAVDYVRQLSGVPVSFPERGVQIGYRVLFLSGRYDTALEMRRLSGAAPRMSVDEVEEFFTRATRDLCFSGVKILGALFGRRAVPADAVAAHLDRLIARGRFDEVPHLFALCEPPPFELLPRELMVRVLESGSPEALRFLYAHDELRPFQEEYGEVAYQHAVARRDRSLVQSICGRTEVALRYSDATLLIEDALDAVDPDWLRFASDQLGRMPPVDPVLAQVFLWELHERGDPWLAPMERLLGMQIDASVAQPLVCVKRGDFQALLGGRGEVSLQAVVTEVARVLDLLLPCSRTLETSRTESSI